MKKIRKLQVQVNFPGSYSVFYLVFFSISVDTITLRKICYVMATIAIKHVHIACVKCISFHFTGKSFLTKNKQTK